MTTEKQKRAVAFCCKWCDEKYDGDINDFKLVSDYLGRNLRTAKLKSEKWRDAAEEREHAREYRKAALRDHWVNPNNAEDDWYLSDALRNDMFS